MVKESLKSASVLLKALEILEGAAERRGECGILRRCDKLRKTLENLGDRIARSAPSEGIINSILRDTRLDALMILTDLKLALQFELREVEAPTEKIRSEIHRLGVQLNRHFLDWAKQRTSSESELRNLLNSQLHDLAGAEKLLAEAGSNLLQGELR